MHAFCEGPKENSPAKKHRFDSKGALFARVLLIGLTADTVLARGSLCDAHAFLLRARVFSPLPAHFSALPGSSSSSWERKWLHVRGSPFLAKALPTCAKPWGSMGNLEPHVHPDHPAGHSTIPGPRRVSLEHLPHARYCQGALPPYPTSFQTTI